MTIAQSLLPEFDAEMKATRPYLERAPEDQYAWRPHDKSMRLGRLATHVAEMVFWTTTTLRLSELDIMTPRDEQRDPAIAPSKVWLLERFDRNVVEARATIAEASDEDFAAAWTLKAGGRAVLTMPRLAIYRRFALNHLIHHRGQLSVYLRLLNVPLPTTYGPSADEGGRPQP